MARRTGRKAAIPSWLATLAAIVSRKPLVLFRFTEDEWESLRGSRRGTNEFTIARTYGSLRDVRVPTACLLIGRDPEGDTEIHFGLLKSKASITTLESRLKITDAQPIAPSSEAALLRVVTDNALKAVFKARLKERGSVIRLSPTLSAHLVQRLASDAGNVRAMRTVAATLDAPGAYSNRLSLQEDAVSLALKAFGLSAGAAALSVDTGDRDTALAGVRILEDAVIEHDARVVPGFELSKSDLTGRAVFRRGDEVLEVITANKRPLEKVLGVDLIYLNAIKQNVVMVQYKMLKPRRRKDATDWTYRPDGQLEKEVRRMRRFSQAHAPGQLEYRINPQVFYLRFVRRDAALGQSTVTMPIDHFEILRRDPGCKGPRGVFRISYDTLDGRYLRQDAFLDLVHSGYIGAYAEKTSDLANLIRATLEDGRAVVAAVQAAIKRAP